MTQTATAAFPRTDLRAAALALAADGHYPEAIRMATLHLRDGVDEELERLLVGWRISAFLGKPQPVADPNWPRAYARAKMMPAQSPAKSPQLLAEVLIHFPRR